MSEQEKKELILIMFLITQELETTQIVFLPEVLKFEDSIIRLNQGITELKYSSYIDCIIKKIKMKKELNFKIKELKDFGFTGNSIEFGKVLITCSTQEDEFETPYYFVYGIEDGEDEIFNSFNSEEVVEFVLNY